jgi:ubiquinone/menaquinone biosynthesis C-methylase UbiE
MQMEESEHEEELIQSRVRHMVGSNQKAYERIWLNPGYVYRIQELERTVLRALVKTGHSKLENLKVLDIGCGTGHWLREFAKWGSAPENLCGVDLIEERLAAGRRMSPAGISFELANATELDCPDRIVDVVMLFGSMCLVFDEWVRQKIASEAIRVLRNDGVILWCDFRYKPPGNHDVRPIGKRQLRALFPRMRIEAHPIHPLPPLLRKVGPYAPFICDLLGMVPFIRTHYFATIRKPQPRAG